MEIINLRKNIVYTGRAATAIYLILVTLIKRKEVILPSNICYAAIYPVICSDNKPVFVDVNPQTGNADFENIVKKVTKNTGAIVFPYMYGNISKDIIQLKKYCMNNNIILIEDCASAIGAKIDDVKVGTFGDYAVFSTGHAKTIDLGSGGFLVTDKSIDSILNENNKLKFYNEKIAQKQYDFSKEYRELRNIEEEHKTKSFLNRYDKELFLYQINNEMIENIKLKFLELEEIIEKRKENFDLFMNNLNESVEFKVLDFQKGSIPWRFTILIKNKNKRKKIIEKILQEKLFVSDWYPCMGKYFSEEKYPNSDKMENEILNFLLTDKEDNILKICDIINNHL